MAGSWPWTTLYVLTHLTMAPTGWSLHCAFQWCNGWCFGHHQVVASMLVSGSLGPPSPLSGCRVVMACLLGLVICVVVKGRKCSFALPDQMASSYCTLHSGKTLLSIWCSLMTLKVSRIVRMVQMLMQMWRNVIINSAVWYNSEINTKCKWHRDNSSNHAEE